MIVYHLIFLKLIRINYELFENVVDEITHVLKVYDDFITYSYKSENKVL